MYTIKLILDNGYEEFIEATSVWFNPWTEDNPESRLGIRCSGHDEPIFFTSGQFYIMNQNGKTIGSYRLSYPKAE